MAAAPEIHGVECCALGLHSGRSFGLARRAVHRIEGSESMSLGVNIAPAQRAEHIAAERLLLGVEAAHRLPLLGLSPTLRCCLARICGLSSKSNCIPRIDTVQSVRVCCMPSQGRKGRHMIGAEWGTCRARMIPAVLLCIVRFAPLRVIITRTLLLDASLYFHFLQI